MTVEIDDGDSEQTIDLLNDIIVEIDRDATKAALAFEHESAAGTFRTFHLHRRMSAIGGKADMARAGRYVR